MRTSSSIASGSALCGGWPTPSRRRESVSDPQRLVFRQGQEVELAGRALDTDLSPLTDTDVRAVIGSETDSLSLTADWGEGGSLSFNAGALPAGEYTYRVRFDTSPPVEESGAFRVDAAGPEWWQLASRPDALRQAAAASGGRLISSDMVSAIADSIPEPEVVRSRTREALLWNHPLVLLAFLSLVVTEWWTRRRSGLA